MEGVPEQIEGRDLVREKLDGKKDAEAPITHQLVSRCSPDGSSSRPVCASSPRVATVAYTFSPGGEAYGHDQTYEFRTSELEPASSEPPNFMPASISGLDLLVYIAQKQKRSLGATFPVTSGSPTLQGRFNFKTPSFQQRLGNVLEFCSAVPIPAAVWSANTGRGRLVLVHDLLEFGDYGGNWTDRFGLAPVGVSRRLAMKIIPSCEWDKDPILLSLYLF